MVEIQTAIIENSNGPPVSRVTRVHDTFVDMNTVIASVLHDFKLAHVWEPEFSFFSL
jgi:hypothetical protein